MWWFLRSKPTHDEPEQPEAITPAETKKPETAKTVQRTVVVHRHYHYYASHGYDDGSGGCYL